jgi:septal ring factor EnvC (AmiA/AmiB activator)
MAQPDAEKAAVNICQHTDDILFSSTPNDYKEATHFNVQSPGVWAELFARQGFYRDVDFDASFVTSWAARYRRNREPVHRLVRDYERKFWLLWKENSDLRRLILENRDQLAAYDQQFHALEAETARLNQVIQDLSNQVQELSFQKQVLTAQLADIHEGDVWKIALRLRALRLRLAPVGSRRERALQQIQRLFRV